MNDIRISLVGGGMAYAGFWRRFAATLIDSLILMVPWAPIAIAGGILDIWATDFETLSANPRLAQMPLWTTIAGFVIWLSYKVGFEASALCATPGKLALGLRVTDRAGDRLSVAAAIIRSWPWWAASFAAIIDAMAGTGQVILRSIAFASIISFLIVAFTMHKQGVHDMMAKSLVVKKAAQFGTSGATA